MSKTKRLNNVGFADSDRNLVDLAQTHGTPLYVYDLRRLRARAAELRSALSGAGVRLFFATMANDREPVLRLLADVGVGACVNSIPHLDLAVASGFIPEQMQFTSTGVTTEDMRTLQRRGIRLNVDSLTQLKTWFELGALEAGIRVNAASLKRGVRDDRIGIEASEVHSAVTSAAELNGKISGLHIYVGTNFQHHEEMLPTLEVFFDFAASIRGLSYVNIGGGIGIDYQHHGPGFDIGAFGDAVSEYTRRLRARLEQHVEVIIEPGRGLTADCATFITSITDVKKLNGKRFATVDGSIAVFPRPLLYPDSPHRVRELRTGISSPQEIKREIETFIVGRTTFSRDILGSSSLSGDLRVGDLLALDDAGAYSQSMASRFLGQPEPYAVYLD